MSLADDASVVPVVSLLMFRTTEREEVLLGVRRSSVTSPRHKDVLSTPTMRIPMPIMLELLSDEKVQLAENSIPWFCRLGDSRSRKIGVPYSLASVEAFVAEALIARKLGMVEALVKGRLEGDLSLTALAYDLIYDDAGGEEKTLMLTMSCMLSRPVTLPDSSEGYSRLDWVRADQVGQAVMNRDPLMLLPDASIWEVCLHGLCVRSAAYAIESKP
jgi:hypothetical protein